MRLVTGALLVFLCSGAPAHGQTAAVGRVFIAIGGGYQLTANDFDDRSTFTANAETGTFTTAYKVKSASTFDIAGGVFLSRWLGVGVGVTRLSTSTPAALSGTVPHPFFFNTQRSVSATVTGARREELGVHMQARLVAPVGARLQLMAFGGPSFFHVRQSMVDTFTWTDSYPYDTAAFAAASTSIGKGTKIGFNAGADIAFFFTRQLGVGGGLQFGNASVKVSRADGNTRDIKIGGTKGTAGLRLRF
jgi:hypothetical protein